MQVALTHLRYTHAGVVDGYVSALAQKLLDAGHVVHYFCRSWDDAADPRVNLHRIPNRWSAIDFLNALSYDRWLTRKVPRSGFDVVHGFSPSSEQDIISARAASNLPDEANGLHRKQLEEIETRRFTPGNFHKVVTPSERVADSIKERYRLSDEDVAIIQDGVDLERFHPRNKETYRTEYRDRIIVPQDTFLVLAEGDGFANLGVPVLIDAARIVRERGGLKDGRQLRIAVVGHESQENEQALSRTCKEKGVWSDVKFYGPQDHAVERWHAMADLFVHTVRSDSIANPVMHALASGVPALVSSAAGAAELVREGETGHVVDPNDAERIAEHFIALADDDAKLKALGASARSSVEDRSWDHHYGRMLELYDEVAAAKQRS